MDGGEVYYIYWNQPLEGNQYALTSALLNSHVEHLYQLLLPVLVNPVQIV